MREEAAEVVREPLIIKYSGFANQMKRITCMDPITTAIVSSLSAGAAFVGKEAATEGIKDAYAGLKAWIQHHYSGVSVEQLEKQPASKACQEVVAEDLERDNVFEDGELVNLAQTLVDLIRMQAPDVARSIGVDLGMLDQANVTFGNVLATGGATGVKVDKVTGGSLHFGDVAATSDIDSVKKA